MTQVVPYYIGDTNSAFSTSTQNEIIRWGRAARDRLAEQIQNDGEVVVEISEDELALISQFGSQEDSEKVLYNFLAFSDGTFGSGVYSNPDYPANLAARLRSERNDLLGECDWTQLPDTALHPAVVNLFVSYRQDLRDVPQQSGWPENISWPTRPSEQHIFAPG